MQLRVNGARSRPRSSGGATGCGCSTSARCRRRVRYLDCDTVDALCRRDSRRWRSAARPRWARRARTESRSPRTRSERAGRSAAAAERIARTRPTAVNLARGVERVLAAYERTAERSARSPRRSSIARDDVARNRAHRSERRRARSASMPPLLTHCNTGALASRRLRDRARCRCAPRSKRGSGRACGSTRRDRCCRARA